MKLMVAHPIVLMIAIGLLDAGRQSGDLTVSKLGLCALVIAFVLLIADVWSEALDSRLDDDSTLRA